MKILNKRAPYDYELLEHFEAGINLLGAEVKAVKLGNADLSGSYVKIIGTEAYLVNGKIFPPKYATPEGYLEDRTRKLLMHKKEIMALKGRASVQNIGIVPISLYTTKEGLIKLELALGKGKKQYEKREKLKKMTIQREAEEDLAGNF